MKKQIIILLIGLAVLINAQVAIPPSFGTSVSLTDTNATSMKKFYIIVAVSAKENKHLNDVFTKKAGK